MPASRETPPSESAFCSGSTVRKISCAKLRTIRKTRRRSSAPKVRARTRTQEADASGVAVSGSLVSSLSRCIAVVC